MNHGAHDDPMDYGEVPGHGPTVILAHLDGDEVALPGAVEHRLRMTRPGSEADEAVWQRARDLDCTVRDEVPPPRSADDYGTDDEDESVDETPPEPQEPSRPTVVALTACIMALIVVECPMVALRVGGAITWDWGWVLAPLWIPVSVATVGLTVTCIALAALDERDAARRRNLVGKGN